MKRSGSLEILIFTTVILGGLFYIFRPIPVNRDNSIPITSMVYRVNKGSENNVILDLKDGEGTFYISHGLDKGLNLETLQKELVNRDVTVLYLRPGFLARFSPVADTKYITELRLGGRVIYSELD